SNAPIRISRRRSDRIHPTRMPGPVGERFICAEGYLKNPREIGMELCESSPRLFETSRNPHGLTLFSHEGWKKLGIKPGQRKKVFANGRRFPSCETGPGPNEERRLRRPR